MQKAERDAAINRMSPEERQTYFNMMQAWRAQRLASSGDGVSVKQLYASQTGELSATLRQALESVVERDEMGPQVGELPPDFALKRVGSDDRVQLSSFRGERPVALVFGSYT